MEHIHQINALQLPRSILTIGSFDGVHLGHRALVARVVELAEETNVPPVVITFFPHPSVILRDRQPSFYISTPDEKASLLGDLGIAYVITLAFTTELASTPAEIFLDEILRQLNPITICIGEDFTFGYQREGNRHYLETQGKLKDFHLVVQPPVLVGGEVVSSTRVREALRTGDVSRVETYLGRPFSIPGRVVKGANRGKSIGFPTANLLLWDERAYPQRGVYACFARVENNQWLAVTNIGVRPTFEKGTSGIVVETHLVDFEGDLYDKEIELIFIERIRNEQKFSNVDELTSQISRDIKTARTILAPRFGAP